MARMLAEVRVGAELLRMVVGVARAVQALLLAGVQAGRRLQILLVNGLEVLVGVRTTLLLIRFWHS